MGRHITSFATRRKPDASASTDIGGAPPPPSAALYALTSSASLLIAAAAAAASSGWSSVGPKILGKWAGSSRPNTRLASVTARWPPLR